MKSYHVKKLMVPLSEYATVHESATLLEAVDALKQAQAAFDQHRYKHRSILVTNDNETVVGKMSQHDVIEALEPNYITMRKNIEDRSLHRFGFSDDFVRSTLEQYHLWDKALENLCEKAIGLNVRNIMYTPVKGEYVNESTTMDEAIHRLILGQHHSLLVTADQDEQKIVGVLRLTDVFDFVYDAMRTCKPG
jgi:CBS-domain-containing membrane protein